MSGQGALWARGLVVGHGKPILPSLDFQLNPGELVALVGPNGMGKSTLLRTLAGLIPAFSGTHGFGPFDATGKGAIPERLAVAFTRGQEAPGLTVEEAVFLGRLHRVGWHGRMTAADRDLARASLDQCGLGPWAHRRLGELSDGERQRVAIARCLCQDTAVVLLDEPTAHLDLENRCAVMELLLDLAVRRGRTILLSTHDYDLALQSAHRLALLTENGMEVGMGEDLVIRGRLAAVLGGPSSHFDEERGLFVPKRRHRGSVHLVWKGRDDGRRSVLEQWTRRALERVGYREDPTGVGISLSLGDQGPRWHTGKREFSHLEGLLRELRGSPSQTPSRSHELERKNSIHDQDKKKDLSVKPST